MNKIPTLISQYVARNRRLAEYDMDYQQFLKSNIWIDTKKYIKQFPEFLYCNICKSTIKLVIHHMSYKYIFNPNMKKRRSDLICLCTLCHGDIHKLSNENKFGLRQVIKKYRKIKQL